MAAASKRARWIGAILVAAAIACGGSKEPSKEGDKGGAPPPAPSGGYETSWTGYVSKIFPGTLDDDVEGVKSALRALGLEITEESGGLFEKNLSAVGGDGTSLVVTVKEISKDQTRVSVKVGYMLGDGDAARRILSEVEGRIGAAKAEAEERRRRWRSSGSGTGMSATTTTTAPSKK